MGAGADARLIERKPDVRSSEFPKFLMRIGGKESFMPMRQAGVAYDNGWQEVVLVGKVLEADFSVRSITTEEESEIQRIADAYSASK